LDAKDPTTKAKFTKEQLISEAGMFIIAGTDSTVTVSCATLFYVLRHPRILDRLTREIRTAFPLPANAAGKLTSEVECPIKFASTELQNINYLYACIDEAMRLSPPHTSILPREIGPGGQIVDGEFFPQGVNLGINMYTLHHSDECFPNALTYAPERWLPGEKGSSEARVSDSSAFTPFGVGRYSCIGKHLAYQDISYILARQIWLYDIRLDPNSSMGGGLGDEPEGRGCEGEFQLYDRYVSEQHGPVVQFRYRKDI
jgi:cytochrome P450